MKLYGSAVVVLLALSSVSAQDVAFKPKDAKVKSAANLGKSGAKLALCPSGDCTNGQQIVLQMSRLEEVDAAGKSVKKAESFAATDAAWTAFTSTTKDGATYSSSSFSTDLAVGPAGNAGKTTFKLTAYIYETAGSVVYGSQTIKIPAGGMKFTVDIGKWPFAATETNKLQFGIRLSAQAKKKAAKVLRRLQTTTTTAATPDKPVKAKKKGDDKTDRVDMSEGMFMDSPVFAIIDGKEVLINSAIATADGKTEMYWEFPKYTTSVFYDPVIGSEDASATTTDTTTSSASTLTMVSALTLVSAVGLSFLM